MHQVVVIGAGIIGLTTAVKIQKEFGSSVSVTIVTEQLSPNTTGDVSAGLWTPYLLQDTPEEDIRKWSAESYHHFHSLWSSGLGKQTGISLLPMFLLYTGGAKIAKPFWSDIPFGFTELTDEQLETLSREMSTTFSSGFTYVAITCEPTKYLPYLQSIFVQNGGVMRMEKIECFGRLSDEFDVVVNCAGLSARTLASDPLVKPVRGQVARVQAPWQNFAMISDGTYYIIPNSECVILGGTSQTDNYNLEVDETDKEDILKNCYRIVPSLREAPILKHQVGLRPGRASVRLELEVKRFKDRVVKIVHNYGHGGSGITLSIGCASEATLLVKSALVDIRSKM